MYLIRYTFDILHYIHTGLLTPSALFLPSFQFKLSPEANPSTLCLTRAPPASNPDREIKPPCVPIWHRERKSPKTPCILLHEVTNVLLVYNTISPYALLSGFATPCGVHHVSSVFVALLSILARRHSFICPVVCSHLFIYLARQRYIHSPWALRTHTLSY